MDDEIRKCEECEDIIEDGDDFVELDDGTILCEYCYNRYYDECCMCGDIHRKDDMEYWGDALICENCLDEQCPSVDKAENEEETTEAYERLQKEYIGKKASEEYRDDDIDIDWGDNPRYKMSVYVDENCLVADISRINAEMMLWESVNSHESRPFPISDDDYDFAGTLIDEYLDDSEPDNDDEE